VLEVAVAPREHYERMFKQMMQQAEKLSPAVLGLLETAYTEARATRYELLRLQKLLPPGRRIAN
jgi:hypothetical protein